MSVFMPFIWLISLIVLAVGITDAENSHLLLGIWMVLVSLELMSI